MIDGLGAVRIFDVHAPDGNLLLSQVRLTGGKGDFDKASGHYHGGAVHNHAYVNLSHVVVDNSVSPTTGQGTTYCDPQFTPAGCSQWGGGGITNAVHRRRGPHRGHVARNSTTYHGGGIENFGRLFLKQTTIAENKAPAGKGGGLWNSATTGRQPDAHAHRREHRQRLRERPRRDRGPPATTSRATAPAASPSRPTTPAARPSSPGLPGAPLYYAISSTSAAEDTGGEGENNCSGTDVRGVTRPQDSDGDSIVECDIGSYEKEAPGAAQAVALSVSSAKAAEGGVGARLRCARPARSSGGPEPCASPSRSRGPPRRS